MSKIKNKITGIGCINRIWSNTNIKNFNPFVSNLFEVKWSAIVFVLDRDIRFNYSDIYKKEIEEILNNEKRLKELIKSKCKNKEYIILENNKHYNGTGSLNVALNYIRNHYKDESWLWQFNDDDDNINIEEANNLIDFILNPTE